MGAVVILGLVIPALIVGTFALGGNALGWGR
jgi:hypothetical protein